jgi:ribose 5-phosphate isomerase B
MDPQISIENESAKQSSEKMCIGVAADHGGYKLKVQLISALEEFGYKVEDFGSDELVADDDFPDYVIPLARSVAKGDVIRGLAICGSGVGACIAANKVNGVRASLITDSFSAHQGVEDDNMNVMCLGGQITGYNLALELALTFLQANFKMEERFIRRLSKIADLENEKHIPSKKGWNSV